VKKTIDTISIIGAGALGGAYASILYDMDSRCVSRETNTTEAERLLTPPTRKNTAGIGNDL
jgi:ketopantoate reductase